MLNKLIEKYKDIISYAFFGVCTTLVNIAAYWSAARIFHTGVVPGTIIAWFLAVLFAYVTNRKWVFHSNTSGMKDIATEAFAFFSCRFVTGIADLFCMYIFVDLMHMNDVLIKMLSNIFVIVLNYILSKFLIFKR